MVLVEMVQLLRCRMDARDPYQVLGVDRSASDAEIKRAFRRLARQHHPDRNPGDPAAEERFKSIQSAYDSIGSPQNGGNTIRPSNLLVSLEEDRARVVLMICSVR